ncbi:hypothetical protein GC722_01495 [Auraticoccus sp. F435]|uniref:DUF624 domain-containing protein n=1 Tax=Auraticoccus cholistanensis TaxID=2656650 RepID=A0A6A9UT13_9ACTN|nr:hypothetical protein [Auraticoccus cholistanensis]
MLGEVLLTGVLVLVLALPLLTLPLALAVGMRHLRRHLAGEGSRRSGLRQDVRRGLLPSLPAGVAALLVWAVLSVDVVLGATGVLPGGRVVALAGALASAAVAVAVLLAARGWTPERGWRASLRGVRADVTADPAGALYLLLATVLVALLTWQLLPLLVPGLGLLAFAAVAVEERRTALPGPRDRPDPDEPRED